MTIIQYRKIECNNCKKIEEIQASVGYPFGWFEVDVWEKHGNSGERRLDGDFCSEKCVIEFMNKTKKLNPKKPLHI